MSGLMRRPRLVLVAVFLLGALFAGGGVVVAATVNTGKAVTAVKVVTDNSQMLIATGMQSGIYTNISGMSLSVTVPADQRALLLITFSAASACYDGFGATTLCRIRVLVDGSPAAPYDVVFESAGDGNATWETNSMQFVAGPLSSGPHSILVQGHVSEPSSSFTVGQRTLSVLRSRV